MNNFVIVTSGMVIFFLLWNYFFMVILLPPQRLDKLNVSLKFIPMIYCFIHLSIYFSTLAIIRSLPYMGQGTFNRNLYELISIVFGLGSLFVFGFLGWYRYIKEKGLNLNDF